MGEEEWQGWEEFSEAVLAGTQACSASVGPHPQESAPLRTRRHDPIAIQGEGLESHIIATVNDQRRSARLRRAMLQRLSN